ncbi:MAG TPA: hypothetical protein VFU02_08395 [Polyangiaceae bacterium]|nr:hypothetical protein [Polyangiaceae bacterium]
MPSVTSSVAVALCVALAVACAGPQRPIHERSPLISETEAVQRFESPARWYYHPAQAADLVTRRALASGDTLFAGMNGERWFYDKRARRLRAASQLAGEPLIAILNLPNRHWLFVGASGTGYEAAEPLGPFLRSSPPIEPLERVSARGTSIAGVRFDGALIQTLDAGATWQRVNYPDEYFADVQFGEDGTGVAFSVPERWYSTTDGGRTWNRLEVPSIGVSEVRPDPKQGIIALGGTSWYDVQPGAKPVFVPRANGPVDEGFKLPMAPPRGPSALALAEQRALLMGTEYLELARNDDEDGWDLATGELGSPIKQRPLALAKECTAVRLAGFQDVLYLACFKGATDEASVPLDLFSSKNGGKTFEREPFSVRAKLEAFRMAVGSGARLVITGICSPQDSTRGCAPHGVYHKRRGTKAKNKRTATSKPAANKPAPSEELVLSAVPGLASTPMAMAFSADGTVAYLVGQRTKSDNYTMFVSRDSGETFRAREVEQLGAHPKPAQYAWYQRDTVQDTVLDMQAAEEGTLSVVIRRGDGVALAVTDDDGRVLSLTPGPGESMTLGAYGTRGMALAPETGKVWETLDGGVSWQPIGSLPVTPCEANRECNTLVRCGVAGCVVGESLTRIGWRGQAESDLALAGPPQSLTTGLLYPRVRTPISCTLGDDEWVALDGVTDAPSAYEAAIGSSVWHAHGSDRDTGAAWAYHGRGGRRPGVTLGALFPPAADPSQLAFAMVDQVEGAAAIRYRVPRGGPGDGEITGIEVAWDNRFENVLKRATLGRSLPFRTGDFVAQRSRTQLAAPDILSIGVGGIYVRPHGQAGTDQATYFLDGRSVTEIPPVKWPDTPHASRDEMVHVGGTHVPIRVQQGGAILTRATRAGEAWEFSSYTLGLPHPEALGALQKSGITYFNGGSAFYLLSYADSGVPRSGFLFPVQATGAVTGQPIEVPQQLDLSDPPNGCNENAINTTPRIVVPPQAGTRHPIIISHRIEPIRTLLSTEAVMHGTPRAPCLAALAAAPVDMDEREDRIWVYAIVLPGDLEHAWAFRVVYDDSGEKAVAYRSMRCEFDPKAVVPKKIYAEPGTLSSEP